MYNFILRLLFKLADRAFRVEYINTDKKALEQWLFNSYKSKGFEQYFKLEDLRILKTLGGGLDRDKYMVLIGRRLQLLYLYDEMRKASELRAAQEAKGKSNA